MSAKLVTLGGLSLAGVAFVRTKPLLLLAYLALEGPRDRYHLAELFWRDSANPLNSLAAAVMQLKQGAPGVVEADKRQVWSLVACDAGEFLAAFEGGRYDEVLALYQGPFLNGVYLPGWGAELEEWVYSTREFIGGRVREAHLRLGEEAAARGAFEDAAGRAQAAYGLRGAAELEASEIERLYTLFSAAHHPQADELRQEGQGYGLTLTLSPEEARASLCTALEGHSSATPHNLPLRATLFIGRDLERAELAKLLQEERLISLVGLAGVGKSRLALQVAREGLEGRKFTGGVYFIPLEALTSPGLVPASIASGLSLNLQGGEDPLMQLVRHIGTKHILLVLDNYEHLLAPLERMPTQHPGEMDGAILAAELLKGCPNLKLLVTSRERLNLEEEVVVPLEGLLYPESPLPTNSREQNVHWEDFDALALFVERAGRARPGFALTQEDQAHVITICRVVEGAPLGIELASAWVRLMPCHEIAEEIEKSLDFLATSTRNVPDRHKSIRAVFEHSWKLLSSKEQEGLERLSVFRGGFTREAAAEVAGVTIPVLASLADKSLLRVTASGRYDRHPLIFSYTQEKLAEGGGHVQTRQKHAAYYRRLLENWGAKLHTSQHKVALATLQEELENILAAWRWDVAAKDATNLKEASAPLRSFFLAVGRYSEAREVFARAVAGLNRGDPEHHAALGYALICQADFFGSYAPERSDLLQAGLALLRPLEETKGVVWGLQNLGLTAQWMGERQRANDAYQQALALAKAQQDHVSVAACLLSLARFAVDSGDYHETVRYAKEAAALWGDLDNQHGVTWSLIYLGLATLRTGKPREAQQIMQDALLLARKMDFPFEMAQLTAHSGLAAYLLGDYHRALTLLLEALGALPEGSGWQWNKSLLLADVGRVEVALGRYDEAQGYFLQSLMIALPCRWLTQMLSALAGLAELKAVQGEHERALELASLVMHHLAGEDHHKDRMREVIATLQAQLPAEDWTRAVARGKTLALEEVVAGMLRQDPLEPQRAGDNAS